MKTILTFLGIILAAIVVLALGGGLLVLVAYGMGWVVNLLIKVEPFQATALGLAGMFVFIVFVDRGIHALRPLSPLDYDDDEYDDYDDDDGDYYDDDDEDDYDDEIIEDEEALDKLYAGIPRWRRPTKNLDFSNVEPNDRCPCGCGRKYKNCHGSKQKKA